MSHPTHPTSRRDFLAFLAGSPLLAAAGMDRRSISHALRRPDGLSHLIDVAEGQSPIPDPRNPITSQEPVLIKSPSEALNVFDFEPVARKTLPPAHWGYLATGTDDEATLRANREGFEHYALRPRRLVDVRKVDPSIQLFDTTWSTPIVVCPVGSQKAFHPQGEVAVARAAKAKGHLQVLSTVATSSIEEVMAARGAPIWFQLYAQTLPTDRMTVDWSRTRQMVKRAEKAGCPAIVLTVDLMGSSNRETMIRDARTDTRDCKSCHVGGPPLPGMRDAATEDNRHRPMIAALVDSPTPEVSAPTWELVKRIQDDTTMKVLVKGIVTREDAELAVERGVSGVWVSNHGGRADDTGRATILTLPEVVAGVRGRTTIIVDSGFRRGTDIFKALSIGANAVGVGRPYIWGLASFGQDGVEAVLAILRRELEMTMRQAGTVNVRAITKDFVVSRSA